MSISAKNAGMEASMSAMDAIYHRRAVRDYAPEKIDESVIRKLLDAAVHAPTAIHEEPWAFAIIQDTTLLKRLSDNVKELLESGADPIHPLLRGHGPVVSPARSSMPSIMPERWWLSTGSRSGHSWLPIAG